jgi:hypothetical protein
VFTPEQRENIRAEIIEAAKADQRICGGAITGSAAIGRQDQWSDIDLAFGVRDPNDRQYVLKAFSERMYSDYSALHHLDVLSGSWIYRVFLLPSTLQVDLAFASQTEFGPRGPNFKLVFGTANPVGSASGSPPVVLDPQSTSEISVGWAWLYALHARSCIKRSEVWRAEYMITGMRNHVISLSCLRHELPVVYGRGVDQLPIEMKSKLEVALVRSTEINELQRAFTSVVGLFLEELFVVDRKLATRLEPALTELCS